MNVDKEIKTAKRLRIGGLIIAAVSLVFILISMLLSIFDYADVQGWDGAKRVVAAIFRETQYPVLSTVWDMAAHVDLSNFMRLRNLGFFAEVLMFMVGAVMTTNANATLRKIADAEQEAIQELRKQQFQRKQQDQLEEQQRRKDKDLS